MGKTVAIKKLDQGYSDRWRPLGLGYHATLRRCLTLGRTQICGGAWRQTSMPELPLPPPTAPLSPRLRDLIHRLRDECPALSRRMLGTLRGTISDYNLLNDRLAQDVYRVGVKNAELWYDSLLTGNTPSDEDLSWISRFSQRRHEQDVSLGALLQAYRTGTRVYLDALLAEAGRHNALAGEVLFNISPFLLHYSDVLSRTVSEAYYAERDITLRLRDALATAVFDTDSESQSFDDAARALGLDPTSPHVALALRLPTIKAAPVLEISLATPLLRQRGHFLLWLPTSAAEANEQHLTALVHRLLAQNDGIAAAGIGLPGSGAAGWRSSAEQAMTAITVGARLNSGDTVYRYADFALDALLQRSDALSVICTQLLDSLAAEPPLLATLEAYFAQRQNHKAVAGALGIHRNTLMHRLARIEMLLGARLDDIGWLTRLYLALRQNRLAKHGQALPH